ncbi:MAG: hypothetical protein HKM06_03785 [Spirochaetales bacterium]|nr:hypothetical protein [Spirochaetales bacterium]
MAEQQAPVWDPREIDELQLGYIKDVIQCKDGFSVFTALSYAHYLVNKPGLTSDNYPVFFQLIAAGNRWVIDTLVGDKDPARFLGNIQPNGWMLSESFRFLTAWKSGEIYPKSLLIILGLLYQNYANPEEGYRLYPLNVNDVNNLGKHLDKTKDQMDSLNRIILTILDKIASLIEPQRPVPAEQVRDVALQANNIRGKFLDMTKQLSEAIPDILLVRGNFAEAEVPPSVPPLNV